MVTCEKLAVIGPLENGWVAFQRMAERGVNQLPVVEQGRLLASLTRERLLDRVRSQLVLEGDRAAA